MARTHRIPSSACALAFVLASACVLPTFENGPGQPDASVAGQAGSANNEDAGTDGDPGWPEVDALVDHVETGVCDPGTIEELGPCDMCGILRRTCDPAGTWTDPSCVAQGECHQGDAKQQACGNCGVMTVVCNDACEWEGGACEQQGCAPGDTRDCMCSTNFGNTVCCGQEVCGTDCTWGSCALKPGKACNWKGGDEYRCCASGKWEYCLSTCNWSGECAACSGCGC